jgi:hypothetical protein
MMSFTPANLADFFAARSRADMSAEQAIKELEARRVVKGGGGPRLATPRAVADHVAQKAGRRLSDLTSHELAELLKAGWGRLH